jgi:hypothetical protein
MNTIKTLTFAAVAALSLSAGAAMAQEGPNATVSGSTYFGNPAQIVQAPAAQSSMPQSGSSDLEVQPLSNSHYYWTPGVPTTNAGSQG